MLIAEISPLGNIMCLVSLCDHDKMISVIQFGFIMGYILHIIGHMTLWKILTLTFQPFSSAERKMFKVLKNISRYINPCYQNLEIPVTKIQRFCEGTGLYCSIQPKTKKKVNGIWDLFIFHQIATLSLFCCPLHFLDLFST